jgi:hypothetical protein
VVGSRETSSRKERRRFPENFQRRRQPPSQSHTRAISQFHLYQYPANTFMLIGRFSSRWLSAVTTTQQLLPAKGIIAPHAGAIPYIPISFLFSSLNQYFPFIPLPLSLYLSLHPSLSLSLSLYLPIHPSIHPSMFIVLQTHQTFPHTRRYSADSNPDSILCEVRLLVLWASCRACIPSHGPFEDQTRLHTRALASLLPRRYAS